MSGARRAEWLLARRREWGGLSPAEVVDGELSPRVERLIVQMREAGLFPDYWDELEVLLAFLGAVAEARALHRGRYVREVRASEGQDVVSPKYFSTARSAARLPRF